MSEELENWDHPETPNEPGSELYQETVYFDKDPYPPEACFSDDERVVQGAIAWDRMREIRIWRLITSPGFAGMDIPVWEGTQHRILTKSTRPGVLWQLTCVDKYGPAGHGDYGGTDPEAHTIKDLVRELANYTHGGAEVIVLRNKEEMRINRERKQMEERERQAQQTQAADAPKKDTEQQQTQNAMRRRKRGKSR